MAYWLSEANNVYEAIYKQFGGRNMPVGETDVFFGFRGCTKTVLLVLINALRDNWGLGWYTSDKSKRDAAFAEIAAIVWMDDNFKCDVSGLVKFENWVFVACADSAAVRNYFAGGDYGDLTNIATAASNVVTNVIDTGKDLVTNILTVPGDSANLVAKVAPWLKWAAIIWGASKVFKILKA